MTRNLPPSANRASGLSGAKMHAPAAARNAAALSELISRHAPMSGNALEIASGTGQHIVQFAKKMPRLNWHPSEVDPDRMASISAYRSDQGSDNLFPPVTLNATDEGWGTRSGPWDLIVLINLLHLISTPKAKTVIVEAVSALRSGGRFLLYGPFMRSGSLTSDGDARFHAQLNAADPQVGYKNDADVHAWLTEAGVTDISTEEMPANNLAFIARL